MKVLSAEFVLSAGSESECPQADRPEIAVSGRSNVGKSSLLNSLFRRRDLAKVSATAGKTQRLNFFLVNGEFHLVDLPGYGYARAPGTARNAWVAMMQGYLQHRRQLVAVAQLVDCRHDPSREDREMVQWLLEERMPFCLVATKVDKLGSSRRVQALQSIARTLGLTAGHPMVAHSSDSGEGREALLAWMGTALGADRRR